MPNANRPAALEAAMHAEYMRLLDMIANQGRYGDSEIAHVNPREAAILRAMGGSGSINPRTGLREYFMGGGEAGDGFGGGNAEVSGSTEGSVDADASAPSGPDMDSLDATGFSVGPGPAPERGTMMSYGENFGPPSPSLGQSLSNQAVGILGQLRDELDPATQRGAMNLALAAAPPAFGLGARGLYSGMEALGRAIGEPINAAFGGNAAPRSESYPGESGFGAGRDLDLRAAFQGAVPMSQPVYTPVDAGDIPAEISPFMGPGLSDLQQRALISTYGTQGVNSAFRSDPVKRYYSRLLQRGLLQDGRPVASPNTLPIEQLYMQNVLGRPIANPSSTQDILAAIGGYL